MRKSHSTKTNVLYIAGYDVLHVALYPRTLRNLDWRIWSHKLGLCLLYFEGYDALTLSYIPGLCVLYVVGYYVLTLSYIPDGTTLCTLYYILSRKC